jgi:hypothetical protein
MEQIEPDSQTGPVYYFRFYIYAVKPDPSNILYLFVKLCHVQECTGDERAGATIAAILTPILVHQYHAKKA